MIEGNDLLIEIENENPKLGQFFRRYIVPAIQKRGLPGQVLATPTDKVGNATLQNLSDLVGSSNPPSSTYVGTNKSGQIVTAPIPSSGMTELTGDVEASGDGIVEATVVGVNGASVPESASSLATNALGQLIVGSASSGALLGWDVFDGSPSTDLGNVLSASRATTISQCVLTVTASDAATDLTFDIEQTGTSIFSTPPTITHGATRGQQFTLDLREASLPVAKGDNFNLDITAGTSSWKFAVYVE